MNLNWLSQPEEEGHWVSISDFMSVLMMIFLFISIIYMFNVERTQRQIKKVAVAYQELQIDLYDVLMKEFEEDLPKWQATIDQETMTIRFEEPDVLFRINSAEITPKFKNILNDFFPRYVRILNSEKYRENIEEIRIEGHTSSEWRYATNETDAYFENMELSQDRTRSVLRYCLGLIQELPVRHGWARKHLTANGLSSSQLIYTGDNEEDRKKSRRVDFRTKTNAEQKVVEIIEKLERL